MMKSNKDAIKQKIRDLSPDIKIDPYKYGPYIFEFKLLIEVALKEHVEKAVEIILEDLYSTEEFEEDLGLNKR